MMKSEFENLAGREVTNEQYRAIETLYMSSNLEKAEFVKSIRTMLKSIPQPERKKDIKRMVVRDRSGYRKTPNGYPLAQAAKDGWLPKFILKENRFGAPYLIYTYTLIVVLIPIVTDMSIVTITNIFQVITFFMNVTVVYAISRLPKRYPEAWAKNKFHFSNGALYTFCTVSIIIYTVIFVKGIFSIKVSYAVAAVIVMLALILIGIYLTKKGGIRIETSLWDPSVKKEEK